MTSCSNHLNCIYDALRLAENTCAEKGTRLTQIRRRVLELIWASHKAHKAYDILEELAQEAKGARPPTVYRALDFLLEMNLIHKIESLNAYVGCPHPEKRHAHQFLICEKCHTVMDIHDEDINQSLVSLCSENNFRPSSKIIEIKGVCTNCVA